MYYLIAMSPINVHEVLYIKLNYCFMHLCNKLLLHNLYIHNQTKNILLTINTFMSTLIVTPSFSLNVVPMLVCPTLYSAILYPCHVCRRLRLKNE